MGAQLDETGAHLRVWATERTNISVIVGESELPLSKAEDGYFSGHIAGAREGELYSFRVDGDGPFADPASRFQPYGPHGQSQFVDAGKFRWTDDAWPGVRLERQVIYEMHIGTFTPEGTWRAAAEQLLSLAELGITVLELMPVADFAGEFGWGYDGVNFFAPTRNYGSPDDFRNFVDRTHALKMGVILDVVYNHSGPDGNYLPKFSESYFSSEHKTDWGAAINFDGPYPDAVREFFVSNAAYWIKEYHLDGLRIDATQDMFDKSQTHILAEITRACRRAAEGRNVILIGENEPQNVRLIRGESEDGYGLDALWNDDFHHSAMVAATGKRDAYYVDYLGTAQELLSAVKHGFLYQGQWYVWQKKPRGTPSFGIKPSAIVTFLQNHDQVANSTRGSRLHQLTAPGVYRALTALLLLAPSTPMLFQGQEFAASSPFEYFANHKPEIAKVVRRGRREFLSQWKSFELDRVKPDDPNARSTFEKCKLNLSECEKNKQFVALHKDLIQLRNRELVFSRQDRNFDGAVLARDAFVLRFFSNDHMQGRHIQDRIMIVNLGRDLSLSPAPEPLLAAPEACEWEILWSSDSPKYGGDGTPPMEFNSNWVIPAYCAIVLRPIQGTGTPSHS